MMYLIIYDISENRIRSKVAKLLVSRGYERIQLSVFAGPFSPMADAHLWKRLQILCPRSGEAESEGNSLLVVEVPLKQFANIRTIGTLPFDMAEMTGTAHTLWW
ncbi:CRISPR-associated endonuclease Cas2 [Cyclobacterium xiamenense]|uniref:CRISPR-associated endoribonuclease Cas2 n=1 Tax=Cyclobacterium xiamenense TaxID=1297121 RepID=A0A1H7C8E9_9BACT|nr:CRISPR-associated endonuclease Cas2 [Cyclobacterium xiamenense]SEJ81925.1 CRISPR-associated endonuclease Cas2 [Cyclobacterium xiamenense]